MNIGSLDRRVTIQAAMMTQDAAGEQVETWTLVGVLWAKKARKSANEGVTAEQMAVTKIETYQTRYNPWVTEKCRLIDGNTTYNIRAVSELGRKAGLEITAEYIG